MDFVIGFQGHTDITVSRPNRQCVKVIDILKVIDIQTLSQGRCHTDIVSRSYRYNCLEEIKEKTLVQGHI